MTQPFGKSIQEPLVKRLGCTQVRPKPHHPLHTNEGNHKPLKSRRKYPRREELKDDSFLRMNSNIAKRIGYVSCARRMDWRLLDRQDFTQITYHKTRQKIRKRKLKRQKYRLLRERKGKIQN